MASLSLAVSPMALILQWDKTFREPDCTSVVRKNADFTYCFACTERKLHPRGENYVAGHCNIPRLRLCALVVYIWATLYLAQ